MRKKWEERNGLGLLLVTWVGIAAIAACQALTTGETVVEEAELKPLPECPAPMCPEPVCPVDQGPPAALAGREQAVGPADGGPSGGTADRAEKVDLNSATLDELVALPGIGPKTAEAIIRSRQRRPFSQAAQLRRIGGIGPRKWRRLKALVTAGKP